MEKQKLSIPTDFTAPTRRTEKHLMPPSHFTSAARPSGSLSGVHNPPAAASWGAAATAGPGVSSPAAAWLAVSRVQGEVLELREENQRLMLLQGDALRGRSRSTESTGRFVEGGGGVGGGGGGGVDGWARREAERRVQVETQRVEAERLRGQLEALKESEARQRAELRDKDCTIQRQGAELETQRCDLGQTRARLDQVRLELQQNVQENQKISSQLETLEKESEEEIGRLRKEEARSREEVQALLLKAERSRREEEGEVKRRNLDLTAQMQNLQKTHQTELQRLTSSHSAALEAATRESDQRQRGLDATATEMLRLQSSLETAAAERDQLRDQLGQARQASEVQASTLQNLHHYIGQLSPQRGEEERLAETVQKLSREKEALEKTADLLTVRLKCVEEILTLQEQKLLNKSGGGGAGLGVLRLWRERVYSLCVRLRTQELELRRERERDVSESHETERVKRSLLGAILGFSQVTTGILSPGCLEQVRRLEEEVKQEQLQNALLQRNLDDRLAQLHLEEVGTQRLKEDLAAAGRENAELRSWKHQASVDLGTVKEALQRFSAAFEAKVAEVNKTQELLGVFSQRLAFATRRTQTVQGLLGRRAALQKVQHSSRQTAQGEERARRLQAELQLLGEEREELSQELRRTPELIDKALAELRETFGCQLKEQQEELDQSRGALAEALSSREEVQQREQETQARLQETEARLEEAHSQLLLQQEQSQQALRSAESQVCERLREMEGQVNIARREHTKAVMSLRQFDRQVTREREQGRRDQQLQMDQSQREIQDLQRRLKEMETDRNLLLASVTERGHVTEVRRGCTAPPTRPPGRRHHATHTTETLLSVLGDLKALSAAVVDGSEPEEEEEEEEEKEEE
ncbi:unnamed protein product [Merluccius merluccius]